MFGSRVYLGEAVSLNACNTAAFQNMRHADAAIQRRANFVAHVGQEGAFGNIGGFGGVLGERQLKGTRTDQFFEVAAAVVKVNGDFFVRSLAPALLRMGRALGTIGSTTSKS